GRIFNRARARSRAQKQHVSSPATSVRSAGTPAKRSAPPPGPAALTPRPLKARRTSDSQGLALHPHRMPFSLFPRLLPMGATTATAAETRLMTLTDSDAASYPSSQPRAARCQYERVSSPRLGATPPPSGTVSSVAQAMASGRGPTESPPAAAPPAPASVSLVALENVCSALREAVTRNPDPQGWADVAAAIARLDSVKRELVDFAREGLLAQRAVLDDELRRLGEESAGAEGELKFVELLSQGRGSQLSAGNNGATSPMRGVL
ncbi:hypothetical protein KEM52_002652, partial [Ascosphaera acerosa]